MPDFLPAQAHGAIEEVFPDLFLVRGSFRFAPGLSIARNMAIVRQGGELVLVNSVRLDAAGEAALERLGKVTHLVRIGAFHGVDDPYYLHRFGARYWWPPGTRHDTPPPADSGELRPGSSPIDQAAVFLFEKGARPEAAILLQRHGGVLLTCDSYQNWTSFEGCSLLGGLMMRAMGFGPALIGAPWAKMMGPAVRDDFERLLQVPFTHLVPAHGAPLRDAAKEGLRAAITRRFGPRAAAAPAAGGAG
jgi:hypothetical protein